MELAKMENGDGEEFKMDSGDDDKRNDDGEI